MSSKNQNKSTKTTNATTMPSSSVPNQNRSTKKTNATTMPSSSVPNQNRSTVTETMTTMPSSSVPNQNRSTKTTNATTMPSSSVSIPSKECIATITGYVHQLSPIKTAHNVKKTPYFNLQIQTSSDTSHRAVCYEPDKRSELLNYQQQQGAVHFKDGHMSPNKRNASQMDFAIKKKTKLQSTIVNFQYNPSFDNKLTQLCEIASLSPYDTVDVKVKVVTKTEERQKIIVRGNPCFKTDCFITDGTDSIRLELWESTIEKVRRGKSYHFQNVKVKVFNDIKYLNTNEFTTIDEIETQNIENLDLSAPILEDSVIQATVLGIDIQRTPSCPLCNANNDNQTENVMIVCTGCKTTILTGMLKLKLVSKLALQIDHKIITYSAFNDALESFLTLQGIKTNLADMKDDEIKFALLTAGEQKLLVDKSTKVVTQFL